MQTQLRPQFVQEYKQQYYAQIPTKQSLLAEQE